MAEKDGGVQRFLFCVFFGVQAGRIFFRDWKSWETSTGRSMVTAEKLLLEYYHSSNATCQSLCWIWTRNPWRIFCIALWVLLISGTLSNRLRRVQSYSVLLPASTVSSSLILVDQQLSWDQKLLEFMSRVTAAGESFTAVFVVVALEPEQSRFFVIVASEP